MTAVEDITGKQLLAFSRKDVAARAYWFVREAVVHKDLVLLGIPCMGGLQYAASQIDASQKHLM
jgi:hypothetical protein